MVPTNLDHADVERVNLDDLPMPIIRLYNLDLTLMERKIAETIVDEEGRLLSKSPSAELHHGIAAVVWCGVSSVLSPRETPEINYSYRLRGLISEHWGSGGVAFRIVSKIVHSVDYTEHHGTTRMMRVPWLRRAVEELSRSLQGC